MAESTLSLSFTDFQARVGLFLGYGADPAAWDDDKEDDVDRVIQSGLRRFYALDPAGNALEFLEPSVPGGAQ